MTDQILPGATPGAEGKRKRNKSVSNMEKTGIEPPEEEEEERPVVNGNDVTVTPGLFFLLCNAFLLFTESSVTSFCSDSMHVQIRMFL